MSWIIWVWLLLSTVAFVRAVYMARRMWWDIGSVRWSLGSSEFLYLLDKFAGWALLALIQLLFVIAGVYSYFYSPPPPPNTQKDDTVALLLILGQVVAVLRQEISALLTRRRERLIDEETTDENVAERQASGQTGDAPPG